MDNTKLRTVICVALGGLAGTLLGCGGSNSDAAGDYVGTWTYTGQSATLSCAGQPDLAVNLGATKDLREGAISDLVDVSTICNYRFGIKDKVASVESGQTCSFGDGGGGTIDEIPSSWTFTLTSATTADEKFMTADTLADGTACSLTGMSTLTRLTKD